MLTESMVIKLSGKSISSPEGAILFEQGDVLERLAKLCGNCGWTVQELLATGRLSYPLGAPIKYGSPSLILDPISDRVPAFVQLSGLRYILYDPNHQRPGTTTDPTVRWVRMGADTHETLGNLASAITADAVWRGFVNSEAGVYSLDVEAFLPGPRYNYNIYQGDGRLGIGGGTGGGGYRLTSVEELDGLGQVITAQFSVIATAGEIHFPAPDNPDAIVVTGGGVGGFNATSGHLTHPIVFEITQSTLSFPDRYRSELLTLDSVIFDSFLDLTGHSFSTDTTIFPHGLGYRIIANPYSFIVFCPEDPSVTSIYIVAPYIPTEEGFTSENAVMCIYPAIDGATYWPQGFVSIGVGLTRCSGGPGFPRMLSRRAPGPNPLRTVTGAMLITGAWVMFGGNNSDTAAVIGKLWDCAIVHDSVGSAIVIDDKRYICLCHQPGIGSVRCSLVMYAPVSVQSVGFVDDPLVTKSVRITFGVDALLTGTSLGGVVVERVNGVQFNASMVGLYLKFPNSGSVQYLITHFVDENHIIIDWPTWPGPTGVTFSPYIVDSVNQSTGGGTVHYISTYGTGGITTSPTGDLTRLNWSTGNWLFDSWMLGKTIRIGGADYTVTRVSDDGQQIAFWPPFSGGPTLTDIPYQIAG